MLCRAMHLRGGRQSCDEAAPDSTWPQVLHTIAGVDSYVGTGQAYVPVGCIFERRWCEYVA